MGKRICLKNDCKIYSTCDDNYLCDKCGACILEGDECANLKCEDFGALVCVCHECVEIKKGE